MPYVHCSGENGKHPGSKPVHILRFPVICSYALEYYLYIYLIVLCKIHKVGLKPIKCKVMQTYQI